MKLRDEEARSYLDDIRMVGLLDFLTWKGQDLAPTWIGSYMPATHSDDDQLISLARFNRDHYLYYRAFIEKYVEYEGNNIDIGCGTSQRTALLARYSKYVTAIDSDVMKAMAGALMNDRGGNVKWVGGDFAQWIKQAPAGFDYAFCIEVIEHVPLDQQMDFLESIMPKLNHGGALFVTTPKDEIVRRNPPHIGLWDDYIAGDISARLKGELFYFNVKALRDGGENPWATKEDATHYAMVVRA